MKHTLILSLAVSLLATLAQGQTVSSVINYQGRVTDSTGMPVGATGTPSAPVAAPVNRKVRFRVYDASTAGTRKYSEEQTVTISLGEFSVLVGQGSAIAGETNPGGGLPAVFTDLTGGSANRFLGITVDNGDGSFNASDFEITPRQQITSTGFAFRAKTAEGLATGGLASASAPVHLVGGGGTVNNSRLAILQANGATDSVSIQFRDATTDRANLGLAGADGLFSSSALTGDTVFRTASANRLLLQNGTGAAALAIVGNNVGIGNTAPTATLDVSGGIKAQGGINFGYTFTNGDTDGGLFSPSDNVVTLRTNGTERLRVDASGNVGIGTTSPAAWAKLHASGGDIITQGAAANSSAGFLMYNSAGTERGAFGMAGSGGAYSSDAVLGDAVLRASAGKLLLQSGSGASAIAVSTANNVGIGTTSPAARLHVRSVLGGQSDPAAVFHIGNCGGPCGQEIWSEGLRLYNENNNGRVGIGMINEAGGDAAPFIPQAWIGTHDNTFGLGNDFQIATRTGNATTGTLNTRLYVTGSTGNIGIGTTSPRGKLEVFGSRTQSITTNARLWTDGVVTNQSGSNLAVSIYATDDIVAGVMRAFSDERIKNIKGVSDGAADLTSLLALQVTDYTARDTVFRNQTPQKKLIAQQVEKVFPQAVSMMTDYVPDVMKRSSHHNGWLEIATNLKKGDRVKLIGTKEEGVFEVLESKDGKIRTGFKPEDGKVFVYGREVNDFRTVDYEAIAMLNVSATQQLKREKDAEIKVRDEKIAALESKLADMATKEKEQEARLARLEQALAGGSAPESSATKKVAATRSARR